jgi:hypothetical protein
MVHEIFDTNALSYEDYIQIGKGLDEAFPVYRGGPVFQRGTGIGDVFRGILRFFMPLIRQAGTAVKDEALNTGQRIIEQIKEGQPLSQTVIEEGKKGLKNVTGIKQFGGGHHHRRHRNPQRPRSIKGRQSNPLSHQTIISSEITKPIVHSKKRLRSDVFGLY